MNEIVKACNQIRRARVGPGLLSVKSEGSWLLQRKPSPGGLLFDDSKPSGNDLCLPYPDLSSLIGLTATMYDAAYECPTFDPFLIDAAYANYVRTDGNPAKTYVIEVSFVTNIKDFADACAGVDAPDRTLAYKTPSGGGWTGPVSPSTGLPNATSCGMTNQAWSAAVTFDLAMGEGIELLAYGRYWACRFETSIKVSNAVVLSCY